MAEPHGQPDVASVDGVARAPAVGHEDEGVLPACDGKEEGRLRLEAVGAELRRAVLGAHPVQSEEIIQ